MLLGQGEQLQSQDNHNLAAEIELASDVLVDFSPPPPSGDFSSAV